MDWVIKVGVNSKLQLQTLSGKPKKKQQIHEKQGLKLVQPTSNKINLPFLLHFQNWINLKLCLSGKVKVPLIFLITNVPNLYDWPQGKNQVRS